MRLIISGGGTGGHVYPALAVVQNLKQQRSDTDVLWIGGMTGMEQGLVERAGLTFEAVSATALRGRRPPAILAGLWSLSRGYRQSRRIMRRFQPDVLLATGGYVCVPVTLAARRLGLPVLIYLPDIEPGFAIKFLARLANRVAVATAEAQKFFRPGLTVVTGYPVRPALFAAAAPAGKAAARRQLGLNETTPVLLIFGGSQGARSINRAVVRDLPVYLERCQLIHVAGRLDEAWVRAKYAALPAPLQDRCRVSAYLHDDMIAALTAADLVVSRAGASVLGEFPAAGLPAILVPYPYAGAHQTRNAEYLARRRAAIIIDNADLDELLKDTVIRLLMDREKLETMSQASRALAKPEAAQRLAQEILELSHGRN